MPRVFVASFNLRTSSHGSLALHTGATISGSRHLPKGNGGTAPLMKSPMLRTSIRASQNCRQSMPPGSKARLAEQSGSTETDLGCLHRQPYLAALLE